MTTPIQKLANDFGGKSNHDQLRMWRERVDKTLKGKNFDETLVKLSEDGMALGPLFTHKVKATKIPKNHTSDVSGRPWHISALIDHPDIEHANKDILADLNGGASAILLNIDPSATSKLTVRSRSDMERLLSGVYPGLIPINIAPSPVGFETAAIMASFFKGHKDLKKIRLSLGYAASTGEADKLISLTQWVHKHVPHWKALSIDGAAIHEHGASPAQELAFMAAKAVSLLRLLGQVFSIDDALNLMDVYLASDQDAHQGIIKFRAARLIWAKLAHSFGAGTMHRNVPIHALSSQRMLAAQDPWANMLRLNSACFGAVCGGADYITVLPFTHPLGLATPFARRMARNLQLLQMEETKLGHVHDPAHGSYMHETLTHELATKAWEIFQHMESLGHWNKSYKWLMSEIKSTHDERQRKIKDGEILLIGVNQYAKPDVRKADILTRPKIKQKTGEIIKGNDFQSAIDQATNGCLLPIEAGQ